MSEMLRTCRAISTPGKGILAADESTGTIGKRFFRIGIENTVENRHIYRQMLFETDGIEKYLSGVILYEETLFDKLDNGVTVSEHLKKKGIQVGIKVDLGLKPLGGPHNEMVSQGLDDLDKRCATYYSHGARFAKFRVVFNINDASGTTPSEAAIKYNTQVLARYAFICQQNGLVPIVEPEVLMDGDFPIDVAFAATERVLRECFNALLDHHVLLEAVLLKPNMVRSGSTALVQATPTEIADATLRVLRRTVPIAVQGIFFLSGGMTEESATLALDAINRSEGLKPWYLSFSYGRALQDSCLKLWKGENVNKVAAQQILLQRAHANSLACHGCYQSPDDVKSK